MDGTPELTPALTELTAAAKGASFFDVEAGVEEERACFSAACDAIMLSCSPVGMWPLLRESLQ